MTTHGGNADDWLNKAFQLAYFLHGDRDVAKQIALNAMGKLEIASTAQFKRYYYTPTGRADSQLATRSRVSLSDLQLLQRLVFVESEKFEREKEIEGKASKRELLTYFIKHAVLRAIGFIFPVQKEISYYSFTIIAFNIFLGIALLPINSLISFSNDKVANICLYLGVIFFLLLYCIRQLRGMFLAANYLTFQKFHFFVYLCTVEIAPILILTKIIFTSAGNSL